ncbi:MAG: hypothetical protein Rsou_0344 [Candidatus Ruthia sp. Asou_11_S2]|nr:hypothetical protein [Candidatus Ruthia sp. Asou_11_S2]
MSQNFKKSLFFIIGVIWLIPMNTLASNFVCGQDLDGNGVLDGSGETASCTQIGSEQFCSIGALSCNANITTEYRCSLDNIVSSSQQACQSSCTENGVIPAVNGSYRYDRDLFGYMIHGYFPGTSYHNYFAMVRGRGVFKYQQSVVLSNLVQSVKLGDDTYTRGSLYKRVAYPGSYVDEFYYLIGPIYGNCSNTVEVTYICPTFGNSCVNNNGIQQCSPNKCIDLDTTPAEEVNPPSVITLDDGDRTVDGACLDQALLFTGRNLSCKKLGLTKNCCKDTGIVFNDSTGSLASSIARDQAMQATWSIVSSAYSAYTAEYALGTGVEFATTQARWAAESAISNIGIDPTSIAISIAISVVTEFIAYGQQDTEAAMLNGSGYCHLVGEYCSKKWPLVGCVVKSESHCCFNSKLGRIIQEQGREQMGMNWGSPESPSCGGFTPDQFQALDFSRIDMSEYYDDIKSKSSSLIQQNITQGVEDYYRQIQK